MLIIVMFATLLIIAHLNPYDTFRELIYSNTGKFAKNVIIVIFPIVSGMLFLIIFLIITTFLDFSKNRDELLLPVYLIGTILTIGYLRPDVNQKSVFRIISLLAFCFLFFKILTVPFDKKEAEHVIYIGGYYFFVVAITTLYRRNIGFFVDIDDGSMWPNLVFFGIITVVSWKMAFSSYVVDMNDEFFMFSMLLMPLILVFYFKVNYLGRWNWHKSNKKFNEQTSEIREAYGARSIGTQNDLSRVANPYGYYIGAPYWHWFGDGHILSVGETGDGKNASIIIPGLISPAFLQTGTSVFCLDPKGENYYVCKEQMERYGYKTYRLNPSDLFEMGTDCLNLFALKNNTPLEMARRCQLIVEALCPLKGETNATEHFNEKAQALLRAYILYLYETNNGQINFPMLYQAVMTGGRARIEILTQMEKCQAFDGIVASEAGTMKANIEMGGGEEVSAIYSACGKALKAFSMLHLREIARHSDFMIEEVSERPTAIFINIPFDELQASSGWIRSMIAVLNSHMIKRQDRSRRLLMMLDEFTQLGHVSQVQQGIVTLRGYGVTFHVVVQQMEQLKANYPKSSKSFFGSAVIHALRVKDYEIAKMLSDMTGKDVNTVSMGENHAPHIVHKQVVTPDQFQNNEGHYLFLNGMPNVIKLPKVFYFKNPKFNGMWRQNPLHAHA